ncbi:MAG: zinc ribbon domain-containing protein [Clostridia bacterium]|nr:zinc ribbon domain-containing protein [Clostridia bacterium]
MAFCRNCGKEVNDTDKFCPYCGVDMTAEATPKAEPKIDVNKIMDTPEVEVDAQDASDNKIMAVLAYIGILVLIPILAAPKSPFARYHSNQGLVLWITEIICGVVGGIISEIPVLGGLISFALSIATLALTIIGIVNAVNGKAKELPVIGKFKILK